MKITIICVGKIKEKFYTEAVREAFAEHFKDQGITKVATIESSGIAPALMTAMCMGLPMIDKTVYF